MATPLENIRKDRITKLEQLKKLGVNPYPAKVKRTHEISETLDKFESLEKEKKEITIAGRIMSLRRHGGMAFVDVKDESGKIQIFISKKEISVEEFDKFKLFDVGDFLETTGTLFITKSGEKTIQAQKIKLLSKSLRPIPDEHFGLKDEEKRYRQRYLDLLLNEDLKELFRRKAKFYQRIQTFFIDKGFTQVYTPSLETNPAGADAEKFETHHNAFDMDLYLRISIGELWQKRLMIAGFDKTFEIGRKYRNEGSSPEHLQEFLDMEFYWAYADYKMGMTLVKELYLFLAKEVYGKTKFKIRGFDVELDQDWPEIDFTETIEKYCGINIKKATEKEIQSKLDELKIEYDKKQSVPRLIDSLWKHCRQKIGGPAFLVNELKSLSPLAKSDPDNPDYVERFHPVIAGSELGNGYSELTDPIDQEERFKEQEKMSKAGDKEAQMHDKEYVQAMEYGMPPTCGYGFSERLFAFFEDKTLRECTMFPLVRPKE